ncbi:MAG: alcohol dehydrogenase catalytic domain-containing protein [Peptostreptococcaceae bacterium]|nr:alcohol dehydrogenase catalytic domain-containing protein [Peptostreptococcaceae bacterium]
MLSIVKEKAGPDYTVKDMPKPVIGKEDVLIKVKAVGICGTDVPILKGIREVPLPMIPGHEFAGDIVEIGENVTEFRIGDRVTPSIVIGCGSCYFCRGGRESLCDNIVETGIHVDGAFAEYVRVPAKVVHKLPDTMSYEQGASIDPIASAYHPLKKVHIQSEDTVVVFGPGPIGLYAIQIAKTEGAKQILVVGIKKDAHRLKLAKEIGADEIIVAGEEDVMQRISDLTEGRMADVVVEATGNHNIFNDTIQAVRKHGQIILIGIFHHEASADIAKIVRKEIIVRGSICYTWQDYKECIDLVNAGRVRVEPIITSRYALKDVDQAMDEIDNGQPIKIILYPEKQ